ncbi:MAG: hypothetical protein ABIH39_05070 [Candidatus Margulisiibacteriota bacterium]
MSQFQLPGITLTDISADKAVTRVKDPAVRISKKDPTAPFTFGQTEEFFHGILRGEIHSGNLHTKSLTNYQKGLYCYLRGESQKAKECLNKPDVDQGYRSFFIARIEKPGKTSEQYVHALKNAVAKTNNLSLKSVCQHYLATDYLFKGIAALSNKQFLFSQAEHHFKNSINNDSQNYNSYYNLGVLYWNKYCHGGRKDNSLKAHSEHNFSKVNRIGLIRQHALFDPYYLDILEYAAEYSGKYPKLTIDNVVEFIKERSFKEQMTIIDALWQYNIKYMPYIKENRGRPLNEIMKMQEGDCDDYVRFVADMAEKLGYRVEDHYVKLFANNPHANITVFNKDKDSIISSVSLDIGKPAKFKYNIFEN